MDSGRYYNDRVICNVLLVSLAYIYGNSLLEDLLLKLNHPPTSLQFFQLLEYHALLANISQRPQIRQTFNGNKEADSPKYSSPAAGETTG